MLIPLTKTLVRLKSDNYDVICTPEKYFELTLEMSTGDFHAHKARRFRVSLATLAKIKTNENFLKGK